MLSRWESLSFKILKNIGLRDLKIWRFENLKTRRLENLELKTWRPELFKIIRLYYGDSKSWRLENSELETWRPELFKVI